MNASFTFSGSTITGVTAARNGRALDVAATAARVAELIDDPAGERRRRPGRAGPDASRPPNLTTEEAQAAVSKMKKISTWTTYFPISERNHFGANIWIPAHRHRRLRRRAGREVRLLERRRAGHPRPRLRRRRRDHQRQDGAAGRPRGRHLLVLDDAVQRRAPGGLRDGRATQPLLLHRPLPGRPRRDGLQERLRLCPDDVMDERHRLPGPHPGLQDQETAARATSGSTSTACPTGRKVVISNPTIKNIRPATRHGPVHVDAWRPASASASSTRSTARTSGGRVTVVPGRQGHPPGDVLLALLADHRHRPGRQGR